MTRKGRSLLLGAVLASAAPGTLFGSGSPGYSLSVLVDGVAVPEYAARKRVYVEAVKGREFVLRVTNPTGRRVAVALSVDGRNVIDAKRTTAGEAAKWVLGPWETIDVPGWQISGATARRFFFTETSRSYARWLGDTANVGTIEAVFYRERVREQPIVRWKNRPEPHKQEGASSEERQEPESDDAGAGVEGGVPGGVLGGVAGESLDQPVSPAPKSTRDESRARKSDDAYAATGIGGATSHPVEWVAFEAESSPAARIAIRYEFREQLVRLGVLPREDELFARDRARGFEHEYAPDPYRR